MSPPQAKQNSGIFYPMVERTLKKSSDSRTPSIHHRDVPFLVCKVRATTLIVHAYQRQARNYQAIKNTCNLPSANVHFRNKQNSAQIKIYPTAVVCRSISSTQISRYKYIQDCFHTLHDPCNFSIFLPSIWHSDIPNTQQPQIFHHGTYHCPSNIYNV